MRIFSFTKSSDSFSGNALKIVSGTVIAQALGVLVTPIIARLFAPEAFGLVAIFLSTTGIMGAIVCLRYEFAIMIPESNEEAANILGVSLLSVIIMTSLSALLVSLGSKQIIGLLNTPELKDYLWLVPVTIFSQGLFAALTYWSSRTKHFGRLSVARIVSSLTTQTAKLAAGFAGFVGGGILIGTSVLGSIVASGTLGGQIWRDDKKLFLDHIRWQAISRGCVRFKKFPLIDTWGALMNSISWQLPALMLTCFFSTAIVGYYALGLAIIKAPLDIISGALSQVFYQKACDEKNIRGNNGELVEKLMESLIFIGLLPIMVLAIVGEEVFTVIFGDRWLEAGRYTQILTPWIFVWFVSSPLGVLFSVYEKQGSALFVHSLVLVSRIISLYIGGYYKNIYLALGLFSATGVIAYGFVAVWNIRLSRANGLRIIFSLMKYALYSLPLCLSLFVLKYTFQSGRVVILSSALAMGILYLIVFRHKCIQLLSIGK
ncbi:MAG: lipopolysaccharide biosynthesis protein [Smithella sp.]